MAGPAHLRGDDVSPPWADRVCVLEPEPSSCASLSRTLRRSGLAVDSEPCHSLTIRHELSARSVHSLVVLDAAVCGDGGGAEVLALLHGMAEQRMLVLTDIVDHAFKVRCLEAGAIDCLSKPVADDEIVARAHALMRRPARGDGAGRFISVGELTLDVERRVALEGAREVALTTREFDLLLHLMRRPGFACPRDQLLAAVWNTPFDPGTNVVDVCVRRLRGKLGAGRIKTFKHVGYSLQSHDRTNPVAAPAGAARLRDQG